jgi:hypothetical protein
MDGAIIGGDQIELEGVGRFGGTMFEGEYKPLTTTGEIGVGVAKGVEIGGSAEGLTGLCPVFFGSVVDKHDG